MPDAVTTGRIGARVAASTLGLSLLLSASCSTGGPVLTGSSSTLGSGTTATPTPSATATPTTTPTATPTPSTSPTATPTPTPTNGPTVISAGTFSLDGGVIALFTPFEVGSAGTLDFVADWISSFDDIDIGIAQGECTAALFQTNQCNFVAVADSAFAKPEEIILTVTPGKFTHAIANATASTEIVGFQLVFIPSASASAESVRLAVSRLKAEATGTAPVLVSAPRGLKSARR